MTRAIPTWCRADLALLAMLAGCSSAAHRTADDPLEPFNRAVYKFNDVADRYAVKPVAKAYVTIIPQFARTGVHNFFSNIDDVVVTTNDLLQLKFTKAASDATRVMANTLFGGLGLVDVASKRGIPKHSEDFGQTLGYWGVGSGPYLVLPLLGPSNLRDGPARFVDTYFDPVWYISNVPERNVTVGLRLLDNRAALLPAERFLNQAAVDRYSFLRDAYMQRRVSLIYDGNPPKSELDDLEDPGEGAAPEPLEVPLPLPSIR
ncbi:MAG: VacJ family lipoprotein [Betaproteobacteria bacterium]